MGSIIGSLILGAIAGWLAGQISRGYGFGLLGNIVVGIVGSLVGYFLTDIMHISLGPSWLGHLLVSAGGAVILLYLIGLLNRKRN